MCKIIDVLVVCILVTGMTGCQQDRQEHRLPSHGSSTQRPNATPTPNASPTPPHKVLAKKGGRSPASSSSASPTSGDTDTLLEQAADNLPMGQVAINHPEPMKVKHADTVRVRISRSEAAAALSQGLPTEGHETEQSVIPVSTSMKVQLSGEPFFDITPLDDTEQLITNKGYTEWSFNVTPLRSGKLPLHVRITAIVRAAGVEKMKDFPVKDEIIQVQVSPLATVGSFVSKNWQWLWSAILVPIALWLWKRRKDQKADSK